MTLALLLHMLYAGIFAYGLAHLFGSLTFAIAVVSLLLGGFFGWRHARRLAPVFKDLSFAAFHPGESGLMEVTLGVFILYAAFRHFAWLLFPTENHLATLSPMNFGDLPMHIDFIRAFAGGIEFPPRNPIFSSETLRYPYGVDLYNALWELVGVRLQAHLFIVGTVSTVVALACLRAYAGWWGMGAFFLSGGLAGWQVLSGAPLGDFQTAVEWKNLFISMFLTQRGMLVALPVGLILLIAKRRQLSGESEVSPEQEAILCGIWGFLPLFHLHSFVAISLLILAMHFEFGRASLKHLTRQRLTQFFLRVILPGSCFILFSTNYMKASGFMRIRWGWLAPPGALGQFLIDNFGIWLFIPVLLATSLYFSKDIFDQPTRKRLWIELGVYTGMFILFFNLMLAPWEWDNIKLLIWPYLGFTRLLWTILEPRMGSAFGFVERPLVAMALFLSGFIALSWSLQKPVGRAVQIYNVGELANAEGALKGIPHTAVFAAAQTHQHVLTFFGRIRVLGYDGHLWSHGLDTKAAQVKFDRLMKGDEEYEKLARELGVTHIYWGPDERAKFGEGPPPWASAWPNLSRVAGYAVYVVPAVVPAVGKE